MIYVLHGDDSFSAAEALGALLDAVGPADLRESNVSTIEAGEFSVEKLGAAAMVVPFLAERRIVVVKGLMAAAEGQRRGRRPSERPSVPGGLIELLGALPDSSDVVFLESKLSAGNLVLAAVKELGGGRVTVREFPVLRREALAAWVADRAAKKGAAIDRQAIAALVDQVGPDLWTMDSEIEKLSLYCLGRTITEEDVRALVASAREASVFTLVDAIMARRADTALASLRQLMDEGAAGPYLLSMAARQARMVALAQELAAQRTPQSEWGRRLGTGSSFVVRKTADQARRFSKESVRGLYGLLLEADVAMKSGTTDELALTEMIARASGLRAPAPARR